MAVEVDALQLNIGASSTEAAESIDKLKNSLSGLLSEVRKASSLGQLTSELNGVKKAAKAASGSDWSADRNNWTDSKTGQTYSRKMMQYYIDQKKILQANGGKFLPEVYNLTKRMEGAMQQDDVLREQASAAKAEASAVREAASAAKEKSAADTKATNTAREATKASKDHKSALQALKDAAHNASQHGIGKLVKQFTRMLRMRAIRSAVRGLINSFKEGLTNLYGWSKYMHGDFASGIDSAKNSLATMKNALGTAIAPVIQAALPYVQQLIQWIRSASDTVSQFFAVLQGKPTWKRAKDVTADAMSQVKKDAKSASDSVNEMLASFDELNVIQQENNNNSGTGNTNYAAYKDLYEEVSTFDNGIVEWANKLKPVLEFVKEHFLEIVAAVGALKLGLGLLNFSSSFTSGLSSLKWLAGLGTISIGAVLGFEFGKDIGNSISTGEALSGTSIAKGIAGAVAAAIGGVLLFGPHGWAIGLGIYIVTTLAGLLTNEDVLDKLGIRKKLTPYDEKKPNNILDKEPDKTSGAQTLVDTVKNGTPSGGAQTIRGVYQDGVFHPLEGYIEGLTEDQTTFKNEITKWHTYLDKAGIDTQTIMDNWDIIAPDINPDNLEKSAEHIVDLINLYGDDWLNHLNWLRDTSVEGLLATAKKFTSTGRQIPKALAKGLAEDKDYQKALQGMLETTELGVWKTKDIVNNADLVAPVIQTFGYEGSLNAMQEIARTCGLNTKTILQNWNLIAPRIDEKDISGSLKDVLTLIDTYGDQWTEHLNSLDLKAEVDVKEKSGWFTELKSRISEVLKNNPIAQAIVNVANGLTGNSGSNSSGSSSSSGSSGGSSGSSSGGLLDFGTSVNSSGTARDELLSLSSGTVWSSPFGQAFTLKTRGKADSRLIETWNLTASEVAWLKNNGYNIRLDHGKTKRGIRQITQFAGGGFPESGQLFLARERGAEFVGTIGGQTAVANNTEIVTGISQGVANANKEQNDLLREQNGLLRALLRKDNSIKPSAALGRVLAQSEAMYDGMVGV